MRVRATCSSPIPRAMQSSASIQAPAAISTIAQGPPLNDPEALTFGPDGSLLVADRAPTANNGRLLRVDLATGAITIVVTGPPPGPTTGLAVAAGGEAWSPPSAPAETG